MESNQNSLERYQRTQMRKENIIEKLRERGCRITKQRQILLDVILKEECSCCKEIYYKAARRDSKIGMATVYRMMNMLEEIGAVSRRGTYKVSGLPAQDGVCLVELEDNSTNYRVDGNVESDCPVRAGSMRLYTGTEGKRCSSRSAG